MTRAPAIVGLGLGLGLAGCGGARAPALDSIGNEAPPSRLRVAFATIDRSPGDDCDSKDLAVRAVDGGRVLLEQVIEGACSGACTPEAEAAGARALAEAQAQVDAGASESLLDYNFIECLRFAAEVGREVDVGGIHVALITGEHPGPHDVPSRYYRLAMIACDSLFLGEEFGSTYTNRWDLAELTVAATHDALIVRAKDDRDVKPVDIYAVSLACREGIRPVETHLATGW